ncbi:NiFeSe hydrogenase maturation protease [Maridesulfovibrio ferrireducens]|uniref:NiFeSe hydrogenase maturation protease n=1 Tax=Maridesulfovibrio ferrireducens TaxID=246191 RepID=UPI001A326BE0|nr:NiFeSe hydrogenase maturation protease [Maridesulfovibrio ferrireducens]MBI9110149.1 HyaD/HybD family hydrogenase maturation endopeptidase [Maridesulfovibrio ferrireducens]
MKKLLVLGVGNILLMDEGVGVHAIEALRKEEWPENVHMVDGGTFTQDLFHVLEGYDGLLVLDIVHAGEAPGTVYMFEEDDLIQNDDQRLSLHDIDLIDSLHMAEMVGKRPRMRVIGMEPKSYTEWGLEMTPEVQKTFPHFLDVSRKEVNRFIEEFNS